MRRFLVLNWTNCTASAVSRTNDAAMKPARHRGSPWYNDIFASDRRLFQYHRVVQL